MIKPRSPPTTGPTGTSPPPTGRSALKTTTPMLWTPPHGQPTEITDPNGGKTNLTYDSQGRLKTVRPPGYNVDTIKYTYSVNANAVDIVKTETLRQQGAGSDQYVQSWDFYDGLGRHIQSQTRHRDSNTTVNTTSSTRYDNLGRVAVEIDPTFRQGTPGTFWNVNYAAPINRSYRTYSYPTDVSADNQFDEGCDTGSNVIVKYFGADNQLWETTRSSQCGLVTRTWDMANHRTTTVADAKGNIETVTDPAGGVTTYAYNRRDQLTTVTDPVGNTTTYNYANWDTQPTSLNDPDLGTIAYTYDLHGRLRTQTDARGVKLQINWDKANRPTDITNRIGTAWAYVSRWTYDPAGHAGQVATEAHWNRQVDNTDAGFAKQTYTLQHPPPNRLDNLATPRTHRHHRPTPTATPAPSTPSPTPTGPSSTTIHNRLEQPERVTADGAYVGRWVDYDASGRPTTIHRGTAGSPNNLATTRTYDPNTQRLTTLVTTDSSGTKVQDFTYTYTTEGLIARIKDTSVATGQTVNQTSCYVYDLMHQLKRAYTRTDHNCTASGTTDNNGPDPLPRHLHPQPNRCHHLRQRHQHRRRQLHLPHSRPATPPMHQPTAGTKHLHLRRRREPEDRHHCRATRSPTPTTPRIGCRRSLEPGKAQAPPTTTMHSR